MAERRSRRGLRVGLIVLAILVLAPIAALVLFAARFDPNAYKPQIAEAVKRATGRDLALNGPIQLKLALHPTIEARDVALANIEGGSRPQMATLDRLDAEIALLPLLRRRLEIDRLVLVRPDILLETTAEGRPNWLFGPSVPSQTLPQPAPANASKAPPPVIALQDVRIEDGVLAYRDGKTGRVTTLGVKRLGAKATSLDSPVNLSMEASYNGAPFTLDGDVGPLSRIQQPDTAAPWPVRLTLASGGARANVSGALSHPAQARGYVLKLDGAVPDLAALQAFYPRAQLPSLRDVTFAAQVSDSGGRVPDVSSLTLHAGTSDLSALVAGLTLAKLDIAASRMDQPVTASAEGSFAGAPLSMTAKLGAPAVLIAGGSQAGPFPVDVSAEAAGASFSAKGGIADPVHLSGADLAVAAHVPDLAALAPLARRDLPPLKDVGFKAQLSDAAGGLAHGVALHGAELTLPEGDLAGDLAVEFGARPLVRAGLTSKRVDFDALRTALMTRRGPTATTPAQPSAVPSTPPRPALPHAEPKSGWLIPDEPLPFDLLRTGDADVTLRLAALTLGGVGYRDITGHVVLQNGQLRLDPFAAGLPGGRMDLTLAADASQATPPVSVAMHAPGLALKSLLHAMGLPDDVSGNVEVDLDLRGAGRTPHAIAAGADGHLGLALVNGQIDNRLIEATLGQILRQAKLPELGSGGGRSDVRCFAARLDARGGLAQVRAFLLDTTLLHLEGEGSLNLADEKLALRLEPLARLGGTGVVVPLRIGGTFRQPKAAVDAAGAVGEAARLAEGASAKNRALGIVIGALGGDRMIAGAGRDSCAEQLAVARGGRPGPVPAALPAGNGSSEKQPKLPKPADLLRQFLR